MYQFGTIEFRPWRLLTAVYAFPLLLAALCLLVADESPKFLMTKGKDKEALAVVRKIYCANSGLHEDSYCVSRFLIAEVLKIWIDRRKVILLEIFSYLTIHTQYSRIM